MADNNFFNRLERLFSTDVIIRNIGGDKLKVVDTNQIQASGKYNTNSLIDRFSRLYISSNQNIFNPNMNYQTLRTQLYADYEAMDTDPLVYSALDVYADEATLKNDYSEVLNIKSSDEKTQEILYNLFYDTLNIEFNLYYWIREMLKMGDFFLKLEIAEKFGIYNVIPYSVYHMSRHEGVDPKNPSKIVFQLDPLGTATSSDPYTLFNKQNNKNVITLENYEVAHFRMLGGVGFLPYGQSILNGARKVYKQLSLLEDAALIHRIMRAPEKRVFFINVGSIPPTEVEQFMQKTINSIKKTPYVDPNTGNYNLKFNMQNMLEDFYLPVRGNDTNTRIETAKGLDYDGMTDVAYFRDKLFAALKVPRAYFGYEGDMGGKATLAGVDIRFARTVERVQRIVESELYKIALVHLFAQGLRGESLANFEISLTTPSIIYEQEKIALMKEKMDLAQQMVDSQLFPSDHIYDKLFSLSEDQFNEYRELVREDAKRRFRLSQIENEGNDPVKTGRSYGTPHDLASMYGRRATNAERLPVGYNDRTGEEMQDEGRPQVHPSMLNTHDDPMGIDKLGKKGMKGEPESGKLNENFSMAKSVYYKNLGHLKEVFDAPKEKLLDESNIKEDFE